MIKTLLTFMYSVDYRCSVVSQVIKDATASKHRQFGVQSVSAFLPATVVLIHAVLFLINLALFITAFIFFQLETEARYGTYMCGSRLKNECILTLLSQDSLLLILTLPFSNL